MAEGTYFDPYVAMDATGGMIPQINGYRTQAIEHYGMFLRRKPFVLRRAAASIRSAILRNRS